MRKFLNLKIWNKLFLKSQFLHEIAKARRNAFENYLPSPKQMHKHESHFAIHFTISAIFPILSYHMATLGSVNVIKMTKNITHNFKFIHFVYGPTNKKVIKI